MANRSNYYQQKQLLPKNPATLALVGCQSWEVQETGKTYAEYEIEEYPSSFIIDGNGHLKVYLKGAVSKEELKKNIEKVLNNI